MFEWWRTKKPSLSSENQTPTTSKKQRKVSCLIAAATTTYIGGWHESNPNMLYVNTTLIIMMFGSKLTTKIANITCSLTLRAIECFSVWDKLRHHAKTKFLVFRLNMHKHTLIHVNACMLSNLRKEEMTKNPNCH